MSVRRNECLQRKNECLNTKVFDREKVREVASGGDVFVFENGNVRR